MSKNFRLSLKSFTEGLSNHHSLFVSRVISYWGKEVLLKIVHVLCLSLLDIEQKTFHMLQEFFGRVCESPFYMSVKSFFECSFKNFIFFILFWSMSEIFQLFVRIFSTALTNSYSFYISRGTLRAERFFFKKCTFSNSFGHWAKCFAFLSKL